METKYPPPSPSTAQTASGNPLWPRDFTPVIVHKRRVIGPEPVQLNMYPMASNANGVSGVHFPCSSITEPRAAIFAVHIVIDQRDA